MRLNISRFDTEAGYDYLWILRLDSNGFQDVLQQWSGGLDQARRPFSPQPFSLMARKQEVHPNSFVMPMVPLLLLRQALIKGKLGRLLAAALIFL